LANLPLEAQITVKTKQFQEAGAEAFMTIAIIGGGLCAASRANFWRTPKAAP
jgi:hypothetical protein